jgi:SAM-dependent methyltransferase
MSGDDVGDLFTARRTSFGDIATEYDAVRPSWPEETVAWMLGSPARTAVLRVLDLGAGTGKGTRVLAGMGHEVVAVEPADGMLEALHASLAALPAGVAARIESRSGGAEAIPAPDASIDAVTVFQAWHWFDEAAAVRECARVLEPGGWLSMAWHHRDEEVGWSRALSDIVERHDHIDDEEAAPALPEAFEPAERELFRFTMRQSVEDLVRHAGTWSFVAIRPDRDEVLDGVRRLGDRVADAHGMVDIPMTTLCYRLRRR